MFDDRRDFAAIGLFDPGSPMRLRLLHHGKARNIDADFWADHLRRSVTVRQPLVEASTGVLAVGATTGYRVVNGENDGWPGLIVDRYDRVLVVKLYTPAWFPHLASVLQALVEELAPTGIVLRLARNVASGETFGLVDGQVVFGQATEPVLFTENGLTFEAHVLSGQKTGHFLDQRDNRQRVREMAAGASVLDVFACTGGFSVYAAAGGARFVQSVDLNDAAIRTAERNMVHNANLTGRTTHKVTVGDAFEVLGELGQAREHFDVVVVDPPSFAKKRADVGRAVRAYARLTAMALPLVARGGHLIQASCSSRIDVDTFTDAVLGQAQRDDVMVTEVQVTGHAIDHPIGFPEGSYLKAVFARVG